MNFPSATLKQKMLEAATDEEDIQVIIDILDEMEQAWYRMEAMSRKLSPATYAVWQEKVNNVSDDWVNRIVGAMQ